MTPNTSPEDRYVDVNGLQLHYIDWGTRTPPRCCCCTGPRAHAHVWDRFAASMSDSYHVVALDQRGCVLSRQSSRCAISRVRPTNGIAVRFILVIVANGFACWR